MNELRTLISEIIKEEIGRNLQTTSRYPDSMFNWRRAGNLDVSISPNPAKGNGQWNVTISKDEKTIVSKIFNNEEEANLFAKNFAMNNHRKNQSLQGFPSNAIDYDGSVLEK